MRQFACLLGLLLLASVSASAQDKSKVDVFGGYSYLRFEPNAGTVAPSAVNFNGGAGSVSVNVNSWFAGVAEFAGYHAGTIDVNGVASGATANAVSYLFGPKLYANKGKLTPFVQVLFGGMHASLTTPGSSTTPGLTASQNAFAMTAGGGLDWNAMPHIAIRLAQVDFLVTRFGNGVNDGIGEGGSGTQNSFRYSGGVVLRF